MKNASRFLPIVIFVIAVALLGVAIFLISDREPNTEAKQNTDPIENIEQIWSKGPDDAKVILVEYSDFQCPACKAVEPIVGKIITDYSDRVRIIYKHYPLVNLHNNALPAAKAAEAAGYQGKFWEMHDLLFANQPAFSDNELLSYAKELNLDTEKFQRYMNNKNIEVKILRQAEEAGQKGAGGTPTFYINDKKVVVEKSYTEIIDALDLALKEAR